VRCLGDELMDRALAAGKIGCRLDPDAEDFGAPHGPKKLDAIARWRDRARARAPERNARLAAGRAAIEDALRRALGGNLPPSYVAAMTPPADRAGGAATSSSAPKPAALPAQAAHGSPKPAAATKRRPSRNNAERCRSDPERVRRARETWAKKLGYASVEEMAEASRHRRITRRAAYQRAYRVEYCGEKLRTPAVIEAERAYHQRKRDLDRTNRKKRATRKAKRQAERQGPAITGGEAVARWGTN
jgi:hypothetical protein